MPTKKSGSMVQGSLNGKEVTGDAGPRLIEMVFGGGFLYDVFNNISMVTGITQRVVSTRTEQVVARADEEYTAAAKVK